MTSNDCINLRDRFGDRYRITFDPAYSARHVPREKLDPWMMLVEFRGGNIYPHGGDLLAVEVEGRRFLRKRLAALPGLTLKQDGDDFQSWTFPVEQFDAVAEIVQPRRRRVLTEAQRAEFVERTQAYRFQSRHKVEHSGSNSPSQAPA